MSPVFACVFVCGFPPSNTDTREVIGNVYVQPMLMRVAHTDDMFTPRTRLLIVRLTIQCPDDRRCRAPFIAHSRPSHVLRATWVCAAGTLHDQIHRPQVTLVLRLVQHLVVELAVQQDQKEMGVGGYTVEVPGVVPEPREDLLRRTRVNATKPSIKPLVERR